jgi:hypothetical protein
MTRWELHQIHKKLNRFNANGQYKNGLNLYEYVSGKPGTATDPFGLMSCHIDEDGLTHCTPTDPTDPMPPGRAMGVPAPPTHCAEWRYGGRWRKDYIREYVPITLMAPIPRPKPSPPGTGTGEVPWPDAIRHELWPKWKPPDPRWPEILPGITRCRCVWERYLYWDLYYCDRGSWKYTGRSEWKFSSRYADDGTVERWGSSTLFGDPVPYRCSCRPKPRQPDLSRPPRRRW